MANPIYLYAASVQGIQAFIFKTDKLKEISGASELVQEICTTMFKNLVGASFSEQDSLIAAAGNIRYLFRSRQDCERTVLMFPKTVQSSAPGITISQAVVEISDISGLGQALSEIENKLRVQRNILSRSVTTGLMGTLRSRQTGLPAVEYDKDGSAVDLATKRKREAAENKTRLAEDAFGKIDGLKFVYETDQLCAHNDWIAVIHADGNGLGQVVRKIAGNGSAYKEFSIRLDEATKSAARTAFQKVKKDDWRKIPIRPVVLGGDDLTVICRGDIALDYANAFISAFEKETKERLGDILLKYDVFPKGEVHDCLTACAGVAFVKSSYPFAFAYKLAEQLCGAAKAAAKADPDVRSGKATAKSCLMFHKVQDSFTEDYDQIAERELRPQENICLQFGPYYINNAPSGFWTLDKLLATTSSLADGEEGNVRKNALRKWLSSVFVNPGAAKQMMQRAISLKNDKDLKAFSAPVERSGISYYPAYDILSVNTIIRQTTK